MYYNIKTDNVEEFENLLFQNNIEFYSTMDPTKFVVEELVEEIVKDNGDEEFKNIVETNFDSIVERVTPELKELFTGVEPYSRVNDVINDMFKPVISYEKK